LSELLPPNPNLALTRLVVAWYWICGTSREP